MVDKISPKNEKTETSTDKDTAFQEWTSCRDVIAKLDDRLTDLRKYGFTLVTALFAVGGLISKWMGTSGTILTPSVQFGVVFVTLILIVTLYLIDDMYLSEQRAAEFRARILETRLNLELTQTTSNLYKRGSMGKGIKVVYIAFLIGATLLGIFVLSSLSSSAPLPTTIVTSSSSANTSINTNNSSTVASSSSSSNAITVGSSPATTVIASTTTPSSVINVAVTTNPLSSVTTGTTVTSTSLPTYSDSWHINSKAYPLSAVMALAGFVALGCLLWIDGKFKLRKVVPDWTVDRVECIQGDLFRITLTNMGDKKLNYEQNAEAWKVEKESTGMETLNTKESESKGEQGPSTPQTWKTERLGSFGKEDNIQMGQTCDWLCDTTHLAAGIYRISVVSSNGGFYRQFNKLDKKHQVYHALAKKVVIREKQI